MTVNKDPTFDITPQSTPLDLERPGRSRPDYAQIMQWACNYVEHAPGVQRNPTHKILTRAVQAYRLKATTNV